MGLFNRRPAPPTDPVLLVDWMRAEFEAGRYEAVWGARARLGLGFAQDGAPDEAWFWLNAYPALAALRRGNREPLVSTCAGWADTMRWRVDDPAVKATNDEIAALFFA